MSLLFNTLFRFVIAFLPRSNHLLISWQQSPSAVILEPKKRKSATTSTFPPSICHAVMGLDAMILVFLIFSFKPALSLSSFTLIKRLFSSTSHAIKVASSAYLRLLMSLSSILILACNSSSPAFLMMCSAYRLNKQGENKQPCCTPFLIWNQSVVPYRVLTVASWSTNRFLRRQVRWSGIPMSLRAFHSLSWNITKNIMFYILYINVIFSWRTLIHPSIWYNWYSLLVKKKREILSSSFSLFGLPLWLSW